MIVRVVVVLLLALLTWRIASLRAKRKALQRFHLENPYRMLPTDDGGESYRMECKVCKEEGSIRGKFIHAVDCPAGKLEEQEFKRMQQRKLRGR